MTTPDEETYPVTLEHMGAFGTIIQWFARHETLLQLAMAGITQSTIIHMLALTSGLGYAGRQSALLSLLRYADSMPDSQIQKLRWFIGELHKHNSLRNDIAHCSWTKGTRLESIKPMKMLVRGGSGKLIGLDDDERDYTPTELYEIANKLGQLYNDLSKFLEQIGLFKTIAE